MNEDQDFNIDKILLEIEAEKVLKQIPVPFGTYEKATYRMYEYKSCISTELPLYFFTTTIHSEKECLEMLERKFKQLQDDSTRKHPLKNYSVCKETAIGNFKIIYSTNPDRP